MSLRRLVLAWSLAFGLALAGRLAAADVLTPLPSAGATAAETTAALMALRRGDSGPLAELPVSAFTAPNALADAGDDAVQRRWTHALPGIIAGLDARARTQALDALDALYRHGLAAAVAGRPPLALAAALLPAPSAVADLSAGADRAFDRGAFADFLAMASLLAGGGHAPVMAERRQQVAQLLSGLGPAVDDSLALPPPGAPEESARGAPEAQPRLAVAWKVSPGWLLACDPWGGILWQHRIDRTATVVAGAGAALVHDSAGLRALTDDGTRIVLGPAPAGARVLAFAGGAAWFATGSTAWRLELAGRRLQALALGGAALAPPLVRGEQSLWLTAQEILLFAGESLQARMRHGLPAEPGWRLASDGSRPLVLAADGRAWRLAPLQAQLERSGDIARAQLLLQAARYQDALNALAGSPEAATPAGRQLLLHAHLGLGPAHAFAASNVLLALVQDPQEEVLVLQAARLGAASEHAAEQHVRAFDARIQELARTQPAALFLPQTLAQGPLPDLGAPPSEWPHALSGAGYALALADGAPALERTTAATRRLEEESAPAPPPPAQFIERRLADGTTCYRQRQLRLAPRGGRTERPESKEVRCEDERGRLLWWHRWSGLSPLAAPSTSLTCRGDAVVVCEGQQRLRVLSLITGALLAQCELDDALAATGEVAVLSDGALALLGPLGVNTRLMLTGVTPAQIELPTPARWLVGVGSQAWVALADGRVLAYPGGTALALPPAVADARMPPAAIARGLVVEDRLYPWRAR